MRNSLIIIALLSCYLFIFYVPETHIQVCTFKLITGIPCPGCGGIRATNLLFQGKILASLKLNPLAVFLNAFIWLSILWLMRDIVQTKDTFFAFIRKPVKNIYLFPLLMIILLNWAWNIVKGI